MPIYEYRCEKCGHTFEKLHHGFKPMTECGNSCLTDDGKGKLKKLISTPATVFTAKKPKQQYGIQKGKQGKKR